MLLRDVGSHTQYHVPIEVGKKLVASGLAVEIVKDQGPFWPRDMKWNVSQPEVNGDYLEYPIIRYRCSCGAAGFISGPTAHKTQKIGHCGIQESPCPSVVAQYEEFLKQRAAMSKKKR
jgi:hypothetical protein